MDSACQQLVEIGDRMVCVRVRGSGPTVVLEAGGGGEGGEGTTGAYGELEERLAAFATVLTYDRAGSGRSDGPAHRRVADMADDLAAVIHATGCTEPGVVVGWTSGGLVAEMFAVRHPDKLAGLVLLNPTELPTQTRVGRCLLSVYGIAYTLAISAAVRLGVFRIRTARNALRRAAASAGASDDALDYVERLAVHPPRSRWSYMPVLPLLFGGYGRETAAALQSATLPDVPVWVLVSQLRRGSSRSWMERLDGAHHTLAQRFPQGRLVTVERASYYLPIDRPDVVIDTIRDVLGLDSATRPITT